MLSPCLAIRAISFCDWLTTTAMSVLASQSSCSCKRHALDRVGFFSDRARLARSIAAQWLRTLSYIRTAVALSIAMNIALPR